MSKINLCELDKELHKQKIVSYPVALRQIARHIAKKIDNSFPEKEFLDWVDSSDDKPFKWNKNIYHWTVK